MSFSQENVFLVEFVLQTRRMQFRHSNQKFYAEVKNFRLNLK